MKPQSISILLFGASGMVGQGVLRECLADPLVRNVTTIGRGASGLEHPKLHEIVLADVSNLSAIESQLSNLHACFFCLGISSAGLSEEDYRRVTYDVTLSAAATLARLNPQMTFTYVSGAGTDSSGAGRVMWARVKGQTENALLALPFKAAYMLRPGIIRPLGGIKSKTRGYRLFYTVTAPLLPLLQAALPNQVLSTAQVGVAMLNLAKYGYLKRVMEVRDIRIVAGAKPDNNAKRDNQP
jgi:uncharacterized protein YbjT (DUF2867 family)